MYLLLAKKNTLWKDQNIPKLVTMLFKGVYYGSHGVQLLLFSSQGEICVYFCELWNVCGNKVIFSHSTRNLISHISRPIVRSKERNPKHKHDQFPVPHLRLQD